MSNTEYKAQTLTRAAVADGVKYMRKPQPDLIAIAFLMFSCALIVWTGLAGPIFADSFWDGLEKWQTLLAALIALGAALLAIMPVLRQLAEQRRQSAAAAVSMITVSALALERERNIVRKARDDLAHLGQLLAEYDAISWHQIYASWPNDAFAKMATCEDAMRKLQQYAERNTAQSPTQQSRQTALDALFRIRDGLVDLVTIMRQETSGLSYEDGEEDIPPDEHQPRRDHLDLLRIEWSVAAERLDTNLTAEIERIWRRIRELEQIAIVVQD